MEMERYGLSENEESLDEKIARGIEQLDRGEGVTGEVARARLQERKAEWCNGGRR